MRKRILLPEVLAVLDESIEVRIAFAQRDTWVGYPLANELLLKMERLYNAPRVNRVKSLIVVGANNSGKTTIKNRFLGKHPAVDAPDDSRTIHSLLHIEAPAKADTAAFCTAIIDKCNAENEGGSFAVQGKQVMKILEEVETKMLVIDEFQNFLVGRSDMKEALLNLIRGICNDRKISILAFGTTDALQVVASEKGLSSRFKRTFLPRWDAPKNRDTLKSMLASLEMTLPLKKASNLCQKALVDKLVVMGEGLLGEITDIIEEATVMAIETGEEKITPALLDQLGWLTVTEREAFQADE